MAIDPRHDHPAGASGVVARLRLWSQLWNRYASGAHLDVSGGDALRARAASRRPAAAAGGDDTWRLEA